MARIDLIFFCSILNVIFVYFAVKSEDSFEVGQFRRAKQEGRKACACALLAIFVTVACVTSLLLFFYVWWFGIERNFFCLFCPAEVYKNSFFLIRTVLFPNQNQSYFHFVYCWNTFSSEYFSKTTNGYWQQHIIWDVPNWQAT